jgi:hypothetical protein
MGQSMSAPTAKQLAAGQRRTLRTMRTRLLDMADQWENFDEFCRTQLTELADQCETVSADLISDEVAIKEGRNFFGGDIA